MRENVAGTADNLAAGASPCTAHDEGRRKAPRIPGEWRRECDSRSLRAQRTDLLAVQAVWSEPVSAARAPEFPVKQGKNREISQNRGIMSVLISRNVLELRQFLSNFPTYKNREFKSLNREIF